MEPLRLFAVLAVFAGAIAFLIVGLVILNARAEKEHDLAFQQAVGALGLTYEGMSSRTLVDWNGSLFDHGFDTEIRHYSHGQYHGVDVRLFDHVYTLGIFEKETVVQTVLMVTSGSLDLPGFELRSENFLDRIGDLFGDRDIDFQEYPRFSRLFQLRGKDEHTLRQTFHPEVLQFLERRVDVCVEGLGKSFLYYRPHRRVDPPQLCGFVEDGIALARLLAA